MHVYKYNLLFLYKVAFRLLHFLKSKKNMDNKGTMELCPK